MSRESFAVLLLFPVGIGAVFLPRLAPLAALAAALFLYCQVRMLQGAKGIPAWRSRATVPLMLATAIAEGVGLAVFFSDDVEALGLFAFAVIARAAAWRHYSRAAPNAALQAAGRRLLELGTAVPLALAVAGIWFAPAAWLAGLLALAGGWQLKLALVTRASQKQEFTLPRLPVRGAR
jgi:phenylacetyl-CoA:acceptor oxidoreductase subunit 2